LAIFPSDLAVEVDTVHLGQRKQVEGNVSVASTLTPRLG
jgi:hypothetical protein